MGILLGSAYGKIGLDNRPWQKALKESKGGMDDFMAALKSGEAGMGSFTDRLLKSGQAAGLSTGELRKMAGATGQFTDKQLEASIAADRVAKKADELTRAVAAGKMTTREAGREFKQFAEANVVAKDKVADLVGTFKSAITVIGAVAAAIVAVGVAAKKGLDFAEAGAKVKQSYESFDLLLERVGAAPDLLDQLNEKAGGTINEMTLMTSTAKLLAGTTGELSTEMANAAPQLVEIARAAVKLDPTLGTVEDVFQSLATGIKRNTPLLIDNANLVVKVGQANEKMAEKLGKSVDALTAEEKSIALLNETLRAGGELMDQVGGSADSATDDVARLKTGFTEAGNAAKRDFYEQTKPLIKRLADLVEKHNEAVDVVFAYREALRKGAISQDEYQKRVSFHGQLLVEVADAQEFLTNQLALYAAATNDATIKDEEFNEQQQRKKKLMEQNADAADLVIDKGAELVEQSERRRRANEKETESLRELTAQQEKLAAAQALEAGLAGTLQGATEDYFETVGDLREEQAELVAEIEKLGGVEYLSGKQSAEGVPYLSNSQREQLQELGQQLEENKQRQREAADAIAAATAEMLYQQAAAGLDADASLELARSMGILSEADYAATRAMQDLRKQYDANADGAITAGEGAAEFAEEASLLNDVIAGLEKSGLPVTIENINAAMAVAQSDSETFADNVGTLGENAEGAKDPVDTLSQKTGDLQTAAEGAGEKLDEVNSALELLKQNKIIDIAINVSLTGKGASLITGGGGIGIRSVVADDDDERSGGRATGGPVLRGRSYTINERPSISPELFIAPANGAILNAQQAQAALAQALAGGGGRSVVYYDNRTWDIEQQIADPATAAFASSEIRRVSRQRHNDFMGVPS